MSQNCGTHKISVFFGRRAVTTVERRRERLAKTKSRFGNDLMTHVMNCTNWHIIVHDNPMFLADWPWLQLFACWFEVRLWLLGCVFYVIHALIEYLREEKNRINCYNNIKYFSNKFTTHNACLHTDRSEGRRNLWKHFCRASEKRRANVVKNS